MRPDSTVQADLNEWNPEAEYDAVIANQALHHTERRRPLQGQGLLN